MGKSCSTCLVNEGQLHFQSSLSNLLFATLNYGGILKSPFEFYSDEPIEQAKLSECFSRLLPIYIKDFDPQNFDWDIGKIDQKLQQERYTPLYNQTVGIEQSSKKQHLVSAKRFQDLWTWHYNKAIKNIKIEPEPTKNQKQNVMLFDIICYHAIIDYVYGLASSKPLANMEKQLYQLQAPLYRKFMKKKFSKSFLNQPKKLAKLLQSLKHIDVAFLQQPTKLLIDALTKDDNFFVKNTGPLGSMIVVRKEKFLPNQFREKKVHQFNSQKKYFDFNGNTDGVALVIDKYMFVSGHLSSKETKNPAEVKALKQILKKMKEEFPEYLIVLGVDANSYVDSEGLKGYEIYPRSKQNITTSKKRTLLQPQFKKANKEVKECKDHIIASCGIERSEIQTIDFRNQKGNLLLPTDQHPFDHLMVVAEIKH